MKKIILIGVVLVIAGAWYVLRRNDAPTAMVYDAVSDATQQTPQTRERQKIKQQMGRAQQGRAAEYTVAPEDYVDAQALIAQETKGALSDQEREGLLLMREEEKLARDVYATLYDQWNVQIFTNIARSEQTHTDAVKALLDRYAIPDPVTNDAVGVFANETLRKLYSDLIAQGEASLVAALTVGATVEDLDIDDLDRLLAQTDNNDIRRVYENLQRGSRNHMRAFMRQLRRNGGDYMARYISQDALDAILDGAQERGGRR